MQTGIQWFDRLRDRLFDFQKSEQTSLPGLDDVNLKAIAEDLEEAELLIIKREEAERLIADGEAPQDLKTAFHLPFGSMFVQFDEPVQMPGERGGLRGMLVTQPDDAYRVRVWFEERRAALRPRYDFELSGSQLLEEPHKRIADLLYWIAGYITSPNVLAIRHNRHHSVVKRHIIAGKPTFSGFYTFEAVPEAKRRAYRRKPGETKPRLSNVHGHFRRAHWHRLPASPRKVWYPTTWVRPYKRRISETEADIKTAA
ncbi:MAG TPA: hypothetical protein PLP86_09125 [Armatimonadota bacterium]|nr:hypothetical protein [Armatimonadota bacterium]